MKITTMKVHEDQILPFTSRRSDNGRKNGHSPDVTRDHGYDQAMKLFDVQVPPQRDHHDRSIIAPKLQTTPSLTVVRWSQHISQPPDQLVGVSFSPSPIHTVTDQSMHKNLENKSQEEPRRYCNQVETTGKEAPTTITNQPTIGQFYCFVAACSQLV